MDEKQHPENIYTQPENGQVYFVRANTIGSDFGFPRLGIKKRYKWKKMNFTTDLPKRNPLVSYIVASAVRCEKFFPAGSKPGPVYRMHAVILKLKPGNPPGLVPENPFNKEKTNKSLYICCHVRRVEADENLSDSIDPQRGAQKPLHLKRAEQTERKPLGRHNNDSKRPRRAATRTADYDPDPYVYEMQKSTALGRRTRRGATPPETPKQKQEEAT